MYSEERFLNPARTVVRKNGQYLATFTDGARTVAIKGQRRKLNEINLPIEDSFNRSRSTNWSAADAGGTWQHVGGNKDTDYNINPQEARMVVRDTGRSRRSMVRSKLRLNNADFNFGFNLDDPDGGHQLISGIVGYQNVRNTHYMNLRIRPANVSDKFGSTLTGTWGTADSGHVWTRVGGSASDYSMSGGSAKHHLNSVNVSRRNVIGMTTDVDMRMVVSTTVEAIDAPIIMGAIARYVDSLNYYGLRVRFGSNNTVSVDIQKVFGGTTTTIGSVTPTGYTYAANEQFNLRAVVEDFNLRIKVWPVGDAEPASWTLETTDNDISGAGRVGTRSLLGVGNNNVQPVTVEYRDFYAVMDDQSQELAVYATKSVEGVSTTISSPLVLPWRRQPGQALRMRVQATNATTSTLRMKVWQEGAPEPSDWDLVVTDSELMPGKVGMRHYASIHTMNLPITSTYSDFFADGELLEQDQPILYNDVWVRMLDSPFNGTVNYDWLKEQENNYKPDVIAVAAAYLNRMPYTYLPGDIPLMGDANYNYRQANGDRKEGPDWSDFQGVDYTYDCQVRPARPLSFQSIDCSGYLRMVMKQFGVEPDNCAPNFDGVRMPRVTKNIEEFGPGVRVIPYVPNVVPSPSQWEPIIQPGDLVWFSAAEVNDYDPSPGQGYPESRIDHVGVYLGVDEQGRHRFISSRKSVNGPQMSDVSGASTLDGTGLYARAFRGIRRI
jgi:cell wall-associated NlpC family hydrolase